MPKRKPKPPETPLPPATLKDRLADAHAEYHRAKAAKYSDPTKTNVEAFHKASGLLIRLERDYKVLQPTAAVMARKR